VHNLRTLPVGWRIIQGEAKLKAAYYTSIGAAYSLCPVAGWPAGVKPGSLLGAPEVIVY